MATTVSSARAPAGNKREVLERIPFFTDAPSELRREFMEAAAVVHLQPGDHFLREGDSCAHFAIVVSGRMRVFKLSESGHEITLYHVGPGEACPLNVSCILSDRPVPAMARIEDAVEAVVVPAATFRAWIAEHESLRTFIFQMFFTRLTEVMSLVEEVAFKRMDQRLARKLADLLVEDGASRGSVEITHADIAADLGTAREVVSRLLKEFERLGAITLSRGRILLRDGAMLDGLAAGRVGGAG
jgi:CRP/FNR family transcriptional regulator, anaerobic regulatory protein